MVSKHRNRKKQGGKPHECPHEPEEPLVGCNLPDIIVQTVIGTIRIVISLFFEVLSNGR
jgi:hypothetical protein